MLRLVLIFLMTIVISPVIWAATGALNPTTLHTTQSYYHLPTGTDDDIHGVFKSPPRVCISGTSGAVVKDGKVTPVTAIPPMGMALYNWLLVEQTPFNKHVSLVKINGDATYGTFNGQPGGERYYEFLDKKTESLTLTAADFNNISCYSSWNFYLFPCFGWIPYTLTYESNGGTWSSGQPAEVRAFYTNQVILATAPTRTGYTFNKWKTSSGGELDAGAQIGSVINSDVPTDAELASCAGALLGVTSENDEIMLTAQWKANTYTIQFDLNGGSDDVSSGTKTYDIDLLLPSTGFSRPGFQFVGWNTQKNGLGTTYTTHLTDDWESEQGAVDTLYAVWDENPSYFVRFEGVTGIGSMDVVEHLYGVEYDLPSNTYTKIGYTFSGWSTNQTTEVVFGDGVTVSNLTSVADVTNVLYAVWRPNTYWIKFDANGGEGEMATVQAEYDAKINLPPNTFTKTGAKFAGWSINETDSVAFGDGVSVSNLTTVANATNTLSAVWSAQQYEISFLANGGTGEPPLSKTVAYGGSVELPKADGLSKPGCSFAGWTTPTGTTTYPADTSLTLDAALLEALGDDLSFLAVWDRADSGLRAALDLDATDDTFALESSGWSVVTNASVAYKDGDCLKVEKDQATFDMVISANGTLTFSWRIENNYVLRVSEEVESSGADKVIESWEKYESTEWATYSIVVTNAPVRLCWQYLQGDAGYALLDNFVWIPEGGLVNPTPTEEHKPVLSTSSVSGNSFGISFTSDSRFKYQLWETTTLSPPSWSVNGDPVIGTGDTITFDNLYDSNAPSKFFKIEVFQK